MAVFRAARSTWSRVYYNSAISLPLAVLSSGGRFAFWTATWSREAVLVIALSCLGTTIPRDAQTSALWNGGEKMGQAPLGRTVLEWRRHAQQSSPPLLTIATCAEQAPPLGS